MAPLLPSGISPASISGLVGVTCTALSDGAQPNDWFVSTRPMNDLKLNFSFFFLLALTNLSAAQTMPLVSGQLYNHTFRPLTIFFFFLYFNVKAIPFPSVATWLTLARES